MPGFVRSGSSIQLICTDDNGPLYGRHGLLKYSEEPDET